MVKASVSPPPWHARVFLERALVISALVHLSAAGLFRAADDRSRLREALEPSIPTWHGRVDLKPPLLPFTWHDAPPRNAAKGTIVVTDEIRRPEVQTNEFVPGSA